MRTVSYTPTRIDTKYINIILKKTDGEERVKEEMNEKGNRRKGGAGHPMHGHTPGNGERCCCWGRCDRGLVDLPELLFLLRERTFNLEI